MLRRISVIVACLMALSFILPEEADARRKRRRRRRRKKARVTKKVKETKPPPARPAPVAPAAPAAPAAPSVDAEKMAAKQKALELLKEGNKKLDAGIYLDALDLFKKAYAIYPSPLLHFNIAQTYNELGKFLNALEHYEMFVKKVAANAARKRLRDIASKRIFKLMGKIAMVEVVCNIIEAKVTADGKEVGVTPLRKSIRLMPGSHAVVITKAGYSKKVFDLKLAAGQSKTIRVKMMTEEEQARNTKVVKALEEKRRKLQEKLKREQEEAVARTRKKRKLFKLLGWSGLGGGVGMMVLGGLFGLLGQLESKKVEDASSGSSWNSIKKHYDNADAFRNVMYYTLPIGGALAIAGGVLLALSYRVKEAPDKGTGGKPATPATSVVPMVGPGNAGLMVRLNF